MNDILFFKIAIIVFFILFISIMVKRFIVIPIMQHRQKMELTEEIKEYLEEIDPDIYIKQRKRDAIVIRKNVRIRKSNGSKFIPED